MYEKFKVLAQNDAYFYGFLILLVGATSFGLGRLSVLPLSVPDDQEASVILTTAEHPVMKGGETVKVSEAAAPSATESSAQDYVASKNGTKYHLPSCPGAGQIKEENKIWFTSKAEAEAAGYAPAANCKGI